MMNYTSISGLSDIRRFPRLGKIHLGTTGVSQNTGRTYPMALDHFLVHADETTSAQSAAAFQAVYPGEPKSLRVMFPGNDTSQIFPQALKSYTVSQAYTVSGMGSPHTGGTRMASGPNESAPATGSRTGSAGGSRPCT